MYVRQYGSNRYRTHNLWRGIFNFLFDNDEKTAFRLKKNTHIKVTVQNHTLFITKMGKN